MYKCTKCGHEFEGKFCPECGAKRKEEKDGEKLTGLVEKVLTFAPTMLFSCLAVLMWIFLAIPVTKYNLFGETTIYNCYNLTGDYATANALISFTVIGFALAVFAMLVLFLPKLKDISFKIAKFRADLNIICIFVEWAVLFSLFVTAAYLCEDGNCASAGIILSFSLIFLLISVAAFVFKLILFKDGGEEKQAQAASQTEENKENVEKAEEKAEDTCAVVAESEPEEEHEKSDGID